MTVAIIGAGLAGLSAAKALVTRGISVVAFDKGRGPGGRMSTRRAETEIGHLRFDHGAQFFTVSSPAFAETVAAWQDAGVVAPWSGRLVEIDETGDVHPMQDKPRFVGVPSMNTLIRAEAQGLEVHWGHQVVGLEERHDGVYLTLAQAPCSGPFERVIVATPAEQAANLLASVAPGLSESVRSVQSEPCWTAMCSFAQAVPVVWDGARISGDVLGWVSRESSKPGRHEAEAWVLQATADWSQRHVDADPEAVGATLFADFQLRSGAPTPEFLSVHRWLYARPKPAVFSGSLWRDDFRIGACGDWSADGRVEGAWKSGRALIDVLPACP